MTRRHAALLIAINALVSAALMALGALWLLRAHRPAFAMLDVAALYRLEESQVAAVLVKRDASDAERAGAIQRAAAFGAQVSTLIEALPEECGCLVLNRGAVVGSGPRLPDLTPDVRRRLGLHDQ
jgi:hypothetical protein